MVIVKKEQMSLQDKINKKVAEYKKENSHLSNSYVCATKMIRKVSDASKSSARDETKLSLKQARNIFLLFVKVSGLDLDFIKRKLSDKYLEELALDEIMASVQNSSDLTASTLFNHVIGKEPIKKVTPTVDIRYPDVFLNPEDGLPYDWDVLSEEQWKYFTDKSRAAKIQMDLDDEKLYYEKLNEGDIESMRDIVRRQDGRSYAKELEESFRYLGIQDDD